MKLFSRFWKKCLVLSTQQCKRLVVYGSESRSQSQEWISWQILELPFIVIAFATIIVMAYSHHDRFPLRWVFVRDDNGGNLSGDKIPPLMMIIINHLTQFNSSRSLVMLLPDCINTALNNQRQKTISHLLKSDLILKLIIMVMVAAYHLHFAELEAVVHLGLALPLNGSASRVGW